MTTKPQSICPSANPAKLQDLIKAYELSSLFLDAVEVTLLDAPPGIRMLNGNNVFTLNVSGCYMYSRISAYPSIRTHIEYHEEVFDIFANIVINS